MGQSKTSTWVAGTVFIALLIMVGSWFLLVSPVLTTAAETLTTAQGVEADNDAARSRIQTLKAQFETLDQSKAELAALQVQVPTTADISDYLRQVDAKAAEHGVSLTAVSPSTPELFASPVPPAVATVTEPETTEGADDAGAAADATTTVDPAVAAAAAAAAAVPAGLIDVPISMTVVGSYANVLAWVDAVQQQTDRLLLVTTVTGTGQDEAAAGGGKPATAPGDVELVVSGYLYVLPDDSSIPVVTPEELAATLPGADPNRNPLLG
jgi:Tfp pilus assembly protein PilO